MYNNIISEKYEYASLALKTSLFRRLQFSSVYFTFFSYSTIIPMYIELNRFSARTINNQERQLVALQFIILLLLVILFIFDGHDDSSILLRLGCFTSVYWYKKNQVSSSAARQDIFIAFGSVGLVVVVVWMVSLATQHGTIRTHFIHETLLPRHRRKFHFKKDTQASVRHSI